MENRSFVDEERANNLEAQLKEAQLLAEEADRKYDEVTGHDASSPNIENPVNLLTNHLLY
jgi:hypothetical protein